MSSWAMSIHYPRPMYFQNMALGLHFQQSRNPPAALQWMVDQGDEPISCGFHFPSN